VGRTLSCRRSQSSALGPLPQNVELLLIGHGAPPHGTRNWRRPAGGAASLHHGPPLTVTQIGRRRAARCEIGIIPLTTPRGERDMPTPWRRRLGRIAVAIVVVVAVLVLPWALAVPRLWSWLPRQWDSWIIIAIAADAALVLLAALWWRLPQRQVARLALKIRHPKARADTEDNFRKTVGQALGGAKTRAVQCRKRPRCCSAPDLRYSNTSSSSGPRTIRL
jgi:hypothetical protein